jgi:hypothetical protein
VTVRQLGVRTAVATAPRDWVLRWHEQQAQAEASARVEHSQVERPVVHDAGQDQAQVSDNSASSGRGNHCPPL